jgi:hypothetical protein
MKNLLEYHGNPIPMGDIRTMFSNAAEFRNGDSWAHLLFTQKFHHMKQQSIQTE